MRFALALAGLLVATTLNAQIYEWKDTGGKTNYSDKPPAGMSSQPRPIVLAPASPASPPSAAISSTQKSAADRELEFRKRQKEAQQNAEKIEKEQVASVETKENCANARRLIQALESGERIGLRDNKGERYFMDDVQREQETAKARQAVQSWCK